MNYSEILSLTCSAVSLLVTLIIGLLQVIQNARINKLTRKQYESEKKHHAETIDIGSRKFLADHHGTIGLLPLCAIAFAYNKDRPYHRKMYNDYRLLPKDVQTTIFERCGWTMCNVESTSFFSTCLTKLDIAIKLFLPKDDFGLFYDHGKYIERAITRYASSTPPHTELNYEDLLSRIVFGPFCGKIYKKGVLDIIRDKFSFTSCSEIEACQIACLTARYIAIYTGQNLSKEEETDSTYYGSPGSWCNEEIETMEDLFLLTLFEIWSNLWSIESEGK